MHNNIPDENIQQSYPASCAIKCQQIILRDYGIDVSEDDLCRIAKENGWYDENVGVYMHDNGKLLGCFGICFNHSQNNTLQAMQEELTLGHRVMVNVNHTKLAGKPDIYNQASHSVVVNSVDDTCVYVSNPGSGNPNESYPIDMFCKAWKDSSFYMLSTVGKALFKYDSVSRFMIDLNN